MVPEIIPLDMRSCGEVRDSVRRGHNAVHLSSLTKPQKSFGVQKFSYFSQLYQSNETYYLSLQVLAHLILNQAEQRVLPLS